MIGLEGVRNRVLIAVLICSLIFSGVSIDLRDERGRLPEDLARSRLARLNNDYKKSPINSQKRVRFDEFVYTYDHNPILPSTRSSTAGKKPEFGDRMRDDWVDVESQFDYWRVSLPPSQATKHSSLKLKSNIYKGMSANMRRMRNEGSAPSERLIQTVTTVNNSAPQVSERINQTPQVPERINQTPQVPKRINQAPQVPERINQTPQVPERINQTPQVPERINQTRQVPEEASHIPQVPERTYPLLKGRINHAGTAYGRPSTSTRRVDSNPVPLPLGGVSKAPQIHELTTHGDAYSASRTQFLRRKPNFAKTLGSYTMESAKSSLNTALLSKDDHGMATGTQAVRPKSAQEARLSKVPVTLGLSKQGNQDNRVTVRPQQKAVIVTSTTFYPDKPDRIDRQLLVKIAPNNQSINQTHFNGVNRELLLKNGHTLTNGNPTRKEYPAGNGHVIGNGHTRPNERTTIESIKIPSDISDVGFYSYNMNSNRKQGLTSTWSTIRLGLSTFFSSLRGRRYEKVVKETTTWPLYGHGRYEPREDIFSRFSLPRRAQSREFADLFGFSEGSYISRRNLHVQAGSPDRPRTTGAERTMSSLQHGYTEADLQRFTARALDKTLKGSARTPEPVIREINSKEKGSNHETIAQRRRGAGFELQYLKESTKRTPEEEFKAFLW